MALAVETAEEEEDEEGIEAGIFGADPFDLRFGAVFARFVLDFSATSLEIVSASAAKKAIDRVVAAWAFWSFESVQSGAN